MFKNELFEGERLYILAIIKGCLDEEIHRCPIEDIWNMLEEGVQKDETYKRFWQNIGESLYDTL